MSYICIDCSHKGVKSGPLGECPACGSRNLKRQRINEEEAPPPRWRLVVLGVLWTYLLALIVWKLVH